MKQKWLFFAIVIVTVGVMAVFLIRSEEEAKNPSFVGIVLYNRGTALLMVHEEGGLRLVDVPITDIQSKVDVSSIVSGQRIRVEYDGVFLESWPEHPGEVYGIEILNIAEGEEFIVYYNALSAYVSLLQELSEQGLAGGPELEALEDALRAADEKAEWGE